MTEIERKALIECLILMRELADCMAHPYSSRTARARYIEFSDIAGGLADVLRGADTIDARVVLDKWAELDKQKQGH